MPCCIRSKEKGKDGINMEQERLEAYAGRIRPLDERAMEEAWLHWDSLCKPLRGMGRLEEMVVQLAGIYGNSNPRIEKPAVVIMGADNGVVAEGVSQTGSEVTAQVLENMGERISSVCIMARTEGIEVIPVNIGMLTDGKHPRIRNRVVRYGTGNIAKEPAMTRQEALRGILAGIETVEELYREGCRMILTGEMGIGNTTPSSAMASVLLSRDPEEMTGRGAGLSSEGLQRKIRVIRQAIQVNRPDKEDVLDVLSKVGSLDIAGMMGCYVGAAVCRIPALIDGFISAVAAYGAARLVPSCKPYMVPTHCSAEPAGKRMLEALGMEAVIHGGMHLGEGTGAVTAYSLYKYAIALYYGLPGWNDGKVEAYEHLK